MSSVQFCFWLQGFFEMTNATTMTPQQVELVKKHLAMVFIHEIDPSFPEEQQEALNAAHGQSPAEGLFNDDGLPVLYRC